MMNYDFCVEHNPKARGNIDEENRLFVHGGIIPGVLLEEQSKQDLMWDRELFNNFW